MTLKDLGITKSLSYKCRLLASIPKDEFEELLAKRPMLTETKLIAYARSRRGTRGPGGRPPRSPSVCPHCGGKLPSA